MRNPVNADYQCPFINSQCVKRAHKTGGPYPVCSVYWGKSKKHPICVCPKRFYGVDFLNDIVAQCWKGPPPRNPQFAHEVKMAQFGTVDFVIADVDEKNATVRNFVSVELQAVDQTGSVDMAYHSILTNKELECRPSYGFNWANVRKRYIDQIITKGFFHHHWSTRIISVIQTPLYEKFREDLEFDELPVDDNCNTDSSLNSRLRLGRLHAADVQMTYGFAEHSTRMPRKMKLESV